MLFWTKKFTKLLFVTDRCTKNTFNLIALFIFIPNKEEYKGRCSCVTLIFDTPLRVSNSCYKLLQAYCKYDCVCIYIPHACLYICNQRTISSLSLWNANFTWTTDICKIFKLFTKKLMLTFCPMYNQ